MDEYKSEPYEINNYEKLLEELINPAVWITKGEIIPGMLYEFIEAREKILSLLHERDIFYAAQLSARATVAELKEKLEKVKDEL